MATSVRPEMRRLDASKASAVGVVAIEDDVLTYKCSHEPPELTLTLILTLDFLLSTWGR